MDARRPGRLLVTALLAAVLFTVALSAPAVAATTLSIHRHPKVVEYTFAGRIFGTLSTVARGRKLLLQRRVWPFTGAVQTVASTRTRRHGRYRFAVSPGIATRYRVVLASNPAVRSRATTVYVKSLVLSSRCTIGGQRSSHCRRRRLAGASPASSGSRGGTGPSGWPPARGIRTAPTASGSRAATTA